MIGSTNEEKTFALIDLYHFSAERQLYILRTMRGEIDGDPKLSELRGLVQKAIAYGAETLRLRNGAKRWSVGHKRHADGAAEIDRDLGKALAGLVSRLRGEVEALEAEHPRSQRAAEVLSSLFPDGLAAVTKRPFVEQATEVEHILDRLGEEFSAEVKRFGLEPLIERIERLQFQYLGLLGPRQRPEISRKDIAERRRKGNMKLRYIAAYVLVRFGQPEVDDDETCERLLGPILAQNEDLRAHHKGRRAGRRVRDALIGPAIDPDDEELFMGESPIDSPAGPEAAL